MTWDGALPMPESEDWVYAMEIPVGEEGSPAIIHRDFTAWRCNNLSWPWGDICVDVPVPEGTLWVRATAATMRQAWDVIDLVPVYVRIDGDTGRATDVRSIPRDATRFTPDAWPVLHRLDRERGVGSLVGFTRDAAAPVWLLKDESVRRPQDEDFALTVSPPSQTGDALYAPYVVTQRKGFALKSLRVGDDGVFEHPDGRQFRRIDSYEVWVAEADAWATFDDGRLRRYEMLRAVNRLRRVMMQAVHEGPPIEQVCDCLGSYGDLDGVLLLFQGYAPADAEIADRLCLKFPDLVALITSMTMLGALT
jgi:hypothetical protein